MPLVKHRPAARVFANAVRYIDEGLLIAALHDRDSRKREVRATRGWPPRFIVNERQVEIEVGVAVRAVNDLAAGPHLGQRDGALQSREFFLSGHLFNRNAREAFTTPRVT